jgi:DNA-binding beta-propeller fold protein YncE
MFKFSRKQSSVHPFRHVDFLRVADWPRVHVWNGVFLYVVDLSSSQILSRLLLDDDPSLRVIDPKKLEMPTSSQAESLLSHAGLVFTDGGKYAYYVSHHFADKDQPGSLRKIDLSVQPPKVISEKKVSPQQGFGMIGVSEAAGIFYGIEYKPPTPQGRHVPTRRVEIYDKENAKLLQEIDLSLTDCQRLVASRDGKYLYALNPNEPKLAVIDLASRQEIKVLDHLGKCPWMMVPLPDTKAEE